MAKAEGLECRVDGDVPLIRVFWPQRIAPSLELLTRTVALSLREVAAGNGEYVHITEVQL